MPTKLGEIAKAICLRVAIILASVLLVNTVILGLRGQLPLVYSLAASYVIGYQPSVGIDSLIDRLDLTDEGQQLFLASRPKIANWCPESKAHGCFITIELLGTVDLKPQIFIHNRQPDHQAEIAGHELLHVAYRQLPANERVSIDAQLATISTGSTPVANYLRKHLPKNYGDFSGFQLNSKRYAYIGTLGTCPPSLEAHHGR